MSNDGLNFSRVDVGKDIVHAGTLSDMTNDGLNCSRVDVGQDIVHAATFSDVTGLSGTDSMKWVHSLHPGREWPELRGLDPILDYIMILVIMGATSANDHLNDNGIVDSGYTLWH